MITLKVNMTNTAYTITYNIIPMSAVDLKRILSAATIGDTLSGNFFRSYCLWYSDLPYASLGGLIGRKPALYCNALLLSFLFYKI